MPGSSFDGADLFGSGPHRFAQATIGEYILTRARVDPFQAGSTPIGPLELTIIVRGRLIAPDDDALWVLRDEIASHLTDPPTAGEFTDLAGRTLTDMSFISFTPADRTDRGRACSIGYTAVFTRLAP